MLDLNFIKYINPSGPITKPELGPCWDWEGHKDKRAGYAKFSKRVPGVKYSKSFKAHRYAYEQFVGPIPEGAVLDHLCRNRGCVNPWHTEPVTQAVNIARGEGFGGVNARKTHCLKGHELVPRPWDTRIRYCPTCFTEGKRLYYLKTKDTKKG